MAALLQARDFLDLLTERVATRSGILLTDHDVSELLEGTSLASVQKIVCARPESTVRVVPPLFEDTIRVLRAAIGNLPDATPGEMIRLELLHEIQEANLDPAPAYAILQSWYQSGRALDDPHLVDEVVARTSLPAWAARNLIQGSLEVLARDEADMGFVSQRHAWDGVMPLSGLFSAEAAPDDPDLYLDQRFIDYLVVKEGRLEQIHWRNFERLTAEFFRRRGYVVKLGPGSKDGGVDLRVWPDDGPAVGPPLLLVQCKRYAAGKRVRVEYVKALYADVIAERATSGLLVTTGYLGRDGKRIAAVRQYPLAVAERPQIVGWLRGMWRHSWEQRRETRGVGSYLSPHPLVVFQGSLADQEEESVTTPKTRDEAGAQRKGEERRWPLVRVKFMRGFSGDGFMALIPGRPVIYDQEGQEINVLPGYEFEVRMLNVVCTISTDDNVQEVVASLGSTRGDVGAARC